MGSFAAGAGTQFVVTSTTSPSGGSTVPGPFTVTGVIRASGGTAANPGLAIPDSGWGVGFFAGLFDTGAGPGLAASNGVTIFRGSSAGIALGANALSFGSSTASEDLFIRRDAANTLAQRNGTNWQAFNIYSTYTDASNYERIEIRQSGASWFIGSNSLGTGPGNRNINLTANGQLIFGANGGSNWLINTSGHFFANTDNTNDIGASAANRPRTVYAGTSVLAPYVRTSTAYTVATLPAAGTAGAGARAYVTDANATTFASIVAGGGANIVPVMSNGTNWIIG